MNILLACQQSLTRHPIPAYAFWRGYFVNGLREAGHEVHEVAEVDWAEGLLPLDPPARTRWISRTWERTLTTATKLRRDGRLDLFLGYLYPQQIDRSAILELRALGIPCVNFFCDNVREYHRLPQAFAPFDLHWVPEHAAMSLYKARGWAALNAPMPCWVPPARRNPPGADRPAVSFIGGRDSLRAALLAQVAPHLPLEIRGPSWLKTESPAAAAPPPRPSPRERFNDWADFIRRQGIRAAARRATGRSGSAAETSFDFTPFVHPSPSDEAYADIVIGSAVSLGINRFPTLRLPASQLAVYSRLRDIEAPMLGACYLTEEAPGLDELYRVGEEIETYRDADELVGKARALLADPRRRARLRAAGQTRALRDHCVGRSLAKIAARLGIAPA